jgi:circadian clock protein KaiC
MADTEGAKCRTGIEGLDYILGGGLPRDRFCLIQGTSGVGKTTLALQFLLEGREEGETGLYIALAETADELDSIAQSHGWNLEGIQVFEVTASDGEKTGEDSSVFHPFEFELTGTTDLIRAEIDRVNPARLVIDSLAEIKLLAQDRFRYRRQILRLKQFLARRHCTAVVLDQINSVAEPGVESIAHGVVALQCNVPLFGAERRSINVVKMRGVAFRGGYHDYVIRTGGIRVFPRLVSAEHHGSVANDPVSSDIPRLDQLLGGGLDRGTTNLLLGSPGTGKSTLATQFAVAAASRGEEVAVFAFDEAVRTFILRSEGLGLPVKRHMDEGRLHVRQVDPAELSPGEFAHVLSRMVEHGNVRMVIIDSVNGYLQAMPDERFLSLQLHELFSFLNQQGVVTILVMAQEGLFGNMQNPIEMSYLTDAVVQLRYFESEGEVKQAISVIKKRSGHHQRSIREFKIDEHGIRVGEPLSQFRGILTGVPQYHGETREMLDER